MRGWKMNGERTKCWLAKRWKKEKTQYLILVKLAFRRKGETLIHLLRKNKKPDRTFILTEMTQQRNWANSRSFQGQEGIKSRKKKKGHKKQLPAPDTHLVDYEGKLRGMLANGEKEEDRGE